MNTFLLLVASSAFVLVLLAVRSTAYSRGLAAGLTAGRAAGFIDGRRFPLVHTLPVWPSPEEFQS